MTDAAPYLCAVAAPAGTFVGAHPFGCHLVAGPTVATEGTAEGAREGSAAGTTLGDQDGDFAWSKTKTGREVGYRRAQADLVCVASRARAGPIKSAIDASGARLRSPRHLRVSMSSVHVLQRDPCGTRPTANYLDFIGGYSRTQTWKPR
jgi:hypothetical protein